MKISQIIFFTLCLARSSAEAAPDHDPCRVPHRIFVSHPGFESKKPKPFTMYQTLDQHGYPSGYTMDVDSSICLKKTCTIIRVTLVWDALGRYQYLRLPAGKMLEKGIASGAGSALPMAAWSALEDTGADELDATLKDQVKAWRDQWVTFTETDYKKLDQILKDPNSLLKTKILSNMSVTSEDGRVDGITGATPRAIKKAVVEGASLTSFHLWHWANGEVVEAARELTHRSCSEDMLRSFLCRHKPHYVLFALDHLKRHRLFSPSLVSAVNNVLRDGDQGRIDSGLAYLREAIPDRDLYYDNLATLFVESNSEARCYLLNLLAYEEPLPKRLLENMSVGLLNTDTYFELHLFLSLMENHQHVSRPMLAQISNFLENENFLIARRAFWYLEKQPLDKQLEHRIETFEEKSRQDNRLLH